MVRVVRLKVARPRVPCTQARTVRAHRGRVAGEQLLKLPMATLIRHCLIRDCVSVRDRQLNANRHFLTETQVREAAAKTELFRLANSR